jgi:tetratricopeptide (TPR) repeat protein
MFAYRAPLSSAHQSVYEQGMSFFGNGEKYDVDKALALFEADISENPSTERGHHQKARIAFLKGDFTTALSEIDIQIEKNGNKVPASFYIRGLIYGYQGHYTKATEDFLTFLDWDPYNWAAINDLLWVLVKDGQIERATRISQKAVDIFPDNPWILSMRATICFEKGLHECALANGERAVVKAGTLTDADWLKAYPGNDPAIAAEGIASFRKSVIDNMVKYQQASSVLNNQ